MSKKFLTSINLARNELQNARIQNLASAPSSPVAGQVYYDTTLGKFGAFNGDTWDYMGTSQSTGDVSSNTSVSVDGEVAVFSGTGGKTIKRSTVTGLAKLAAGVLSAATAGTDYYAPGATDVAVSDGGTGASTASQARTNLGLAIGTDVLAPNGNGSQLTGLTQSQIGGLVSDLAAKAPTNSPTFTGVVTVPTPTGATDAANKGYVDNAVQGLAWKQAARVATTGNISLTGLQTIDGVALAVGDRVLVKDQTTASNNGIYVVSASGWSRSADTNTSTQIRGMAIYIEEGATNADTVWTLTTDSPVIGTTPLVFGQINGGAVPTASTSTAGKVQLATQGEAQAKSNSTKAVTPASLADFARKYTGTIGDGTSSSIAVTHGLGSQYVTAQAFEVATNALIECDITLTSATQTTFGFATPPSANAIRVVITG